MPVLNEGERIAATLDALAPLRALGVEIVVVDGGSRDATVQRARLRADRVISGAARARHADECRRRKGHRRRPAVPARRYAAAVRCGPCSAQRLGTVRARAGAVSTSGSTARDPLLRVVAAHDELRSRLTGIATGDQAIFVKRDAFQKVGGFPPIALMEDIALSKRLKRIGRPLCLRERVDHLRAGAGRSTA